MIVWGQRVTPRHVVDVTSTSGGTVRLGCLDDEMLEQLLSVDRNQLAEIPQQEIISFLARCGALWRSDEYTRRRLFLRHLQDVMGYSEAMAQAEADLIGSLLTSHWRLRDTLGVELGSPHIMDRWISREDCDVRAFPRGLVTHLLPGNVPLSSVISLLRAVLTKNVSIAKVSGGDPVTALALALSFRDVDVDHPVTRSVSVVYWPKDDSLGAKAVGASDAVCVWGGESAIRWAQENAAPEAQRLVFGPKRSVAVVGRDADLAKAALGLAHDVCCYEQRACFSMHQVFVEQPVEPFVAALHDALDRYDTILPPACHSADDLATAALERAAQEFLGSAVATTGRWTTVVGSPANVGTLPGVRTVFVHPVDGVADVVPWLDSGVQTVAFAPWRTVLALRDDMAGRGVTRFVELGLANFFRLGGTHDATQPLGGLVRLVATESPSEYHGKGMVLPIDQTAMLEHRQLRDLIL